MPEPRRIWEIHRSYLCPVVGFCLSSEERRSIVKKSAPGPLRALEGIELHERLVTLLGEEGPAAERAERLLDRKFAREIKAHQSDDFNAWRDAAPLYLNAEGFGAYIWISAKYALYGDKENDAIYGLIHMYSHELRDELVAERRAAAIKDKEALRLADSLRSSRQRIRTLEAELSSLKKSVNAERSKAAASDSRLASPAPRPSAPPIGKAALSADSPDPTRIAGLLRENEALKEANRRLSAYERQSVEWLDRAKADMESLFASLSRQACPPDAAGCGACDASERGKPCDLCERRVLVVGGISRLKGFYRDLVARMNGSFLYHDGDCHNSGLPEMIRQADVVLCPVDVNSHAACLTVKRACKDTGKDFYMLRKSSVTSVYETLAKVACG